MSIARKGANFERKVKKELENKGFFVIRSAGSHSPIDLVAIKKKKVLLIQCKKSGKITKLELKKLESLKEDLGFKVFLAYEEKGIKMKEL